MKLGIDFGTSFSLPAVHHMNNNIVLLPSGKYGIPSVFYYDEYDGVLIGEAAEDAGQGDQAKYLIREIKMDLKSSFIVDDKKFSSKEIVGYILREVVETALNIAKIKLITEELEGVVISIPAAFEHNEKHLIKEAAEIPQNKGGPDLKVLGFIKEPVAAALAYFNDSLEDHTKILVYDLGGGTCDVAIIEADSSIAEKYIVLNSDMERVGGKDWDERIEMYIADELERETGINSFRDSNHKEKIKRAAISVKHSFSEKVGATYRDKSSAKVEINGRLHRINITRKIFDELTLDLMNRTINLTKKLLNQTDCDYINRIICVGGSSNMPQVTNGLKRAFPNMEIQVYEPEKAVAIGTAIYTKFCTSNGINTMKLLDIAAFSYGIKCFENYDKDPKKNIIVNLIKKSDELPITKHHSFSTIEYNQTIVSFKVYESKNTTNQYDYYENMENSHIMEVVLKLPEGLPKNTTIYTYMTLTIDGLIEVVADDRNGHISKGRKELNY